MNIRPISIGIPPKAWHSLSLFGDFLQWSNKLEERNFKAIVERGGRAQGDTKTTTENMEDSYPVQGCCM